MVPWLWFLTRDADCRIFQNQTIPDIIKKVFTDLGFNDFTDSRKALIPPRDYCVQYRETDFNFVSRLMEEYGIFYFFKHEEGKHTLVLADDPSAHQDCPGQSNSVSSRSQMPPGRGRGERLAGGAGTAHREIHPHGLQFPNPEHQLLVNHPTLDNVGGNSKYDTYDYPGKYLNKACRPTPGENPHAGRRGRVSGQSWDQRCAQP